MFQLNLKCAHSIQYACISKALSTSIGIDTFKPKHCSHIAHSLTFFYYSPAFIADFSCSFNFSRSLLFTLPQHASLCVFVTVVVSVALSVAAAVPFGCSIYAQYLFALHFHLSIISCVISVCRSVD